MKIKEKKKKKRKEKKEKVVDVKPDVSKPHVCT